ncbi:MAG: TetR/AcrR family transcriptional regulator [Actinobacteria bacterium]|jgi:AcrR family transcriptional regulator|nr:TetR/AcrR family transcriptional regulator [Actinomycetota bacterium]
MGESASSEAVLAAAMRAIAERGPEKLTMSAVAKSAGLSRPTLYRWFPTKADLLLALGKYAEEQFDAGLRTLVEERREPADRLDAALRYLVSYLDEAMGSDPIGVDLAFALKSLAASLDPHVEALARLLGDSLAQVPAVRSGALSPEGAAELFLRLAYSHYLLPHEDSETLLANLQALAGID